MKTNQKSPFTSILRTGLLASLTVAFLAGSVLLSGCGKAKTETKVPTVKTHKYVDGSAVIKAFEKAGPDVKYVLDQQVKIAEAGGYGDALPQLKKIAANAKMTPEQKQALDDFITKVQSKMSGQ